MSALTNLIPGLRTAPDQAEPSAPGTRSGSGMVAYRLTKVSGVDTNPQSFSSKAAIFATTATAGGGSATIVVQRSGAATTNWVILSPDAAAANAQMTLAQTVGARLEPDPGPDMLGASPVIAHLQHAHSPVMRDTQAVYDPANLPRMLSTAMADGTWLAITIRQPSAREQSQWRTWLDHRTNTVHGTHHSTAAGATITHISAGGGDARQVASVLEMAASAMPGFDLKAKVTTPTGRSVAMRPLGIAAAAGAVGAFSKHLTSSAASGLDALAELVTGTSVESAQILTQAADTVGASYALITLIALSVAIAFGLPALLTVLGYRATPEARLRAALNNGTFPTPARRRGKVRPPRAAGTKEVYRTVQGQRTVEHVKVKAHPGDYPLHPSTFMLGASVWAAAASPHGSTGEVTTAERTVPASMTFRIGPMIGTSNGTPAVLDASTMSLGTVAVGRPSSGKSVTVRSLFGYSCMERVSPSGIPGAPGRQNTLIAFESKGDGMDQYVSWAHTLGDSCLPIDVVDPSTPAIDLFDVPGDLVDRASFFTNAMRYAFGAEAIGDRSFSTLVQVFTAALAVTDELVATIDAPDPTTARYLTPGRSPVYWAHVLLGGFGDTAGVTLYNALRAASQSAAEAGTPDPDLDAAVDALPSLYDGKTESARRTFQEAPRSKTDQLLHMEQWFAPTRSRRSWKAIITGHRSVVINTGSSAAGMLDENDSAKISSMLMFSLKAAIQRYCSGWEAQGRYVSLFADELALLAGTSPEIFGWVRDQGRSYGLRPVLATQRPEQLSPALRNNLYTYATLITYAQNDVATAEELARNLGDGWSASDIQHLEPYHAAVRSEVGKRLQPVFTVAMTNFEADRPGYAAAQLAVPLPGTTGTTPLAGAQ